MQKMPKHYISHYKSANIIIEPTVITPTPPPPKKAKIDGSPHYIYDYKSPNVMIQPTVTIPTSPLPKRYNTDGSPTKQSPKSDDISFLDDFNIDEIVSCLRSISKSDEKLDNKSDIKMFEQRCTETNNTAKPEHDVKETDKQNKNGTPIEKFMDNIETNKLTLKEDINSTLSFKFIEHPAAEVKSSDLNDDPDNCITININVNLVTNDHLKTTCVKIVGAENKVMHSSKTDISSINNKLCEGDNFKTELKSAVIIRNRDDILLASLEKFMIKSLHIKCSVRSIIHYGKYSKIFKCKSSTGEEYAIKMLNLKRRNYKGFQTNMLLKQIQSDIPKDNLFCIFLHDCFTVNKHWCFLMEFYPNDLSKVINDSNKPLNIHIVQDLARQLISAVMLLRNYHVVHSDIKPNHILLNCTNDRLKLCGFDKAYYNEQACISECIGTLNYQPPEVILGYPASFSIDVWSTGLVLYEMVTGKTLFTGYNNADILYQQMSTLGNMPPEMITFSRFGAQYFIADKLTERFGFRKKRAEIIGHFNETTKLNRTVNDAYLKHWAPSRTKNERKYDKQKINLLVNLLENMIVLYPERRLTIESVFANPFIRNIYN